MSSLLTLREYLAAQKVRLLDINYDLRFAGQDYPALIEELERLGAVRIQQSKWWLLTPLSAHQLRLHLMPYIDGNDSLLVAELTGEVSGWETRQQLRDWMNFVLSQRAA